MLKNDPLTGRRWGDHGSALSAVEYALGDFDPNMRGQEREFLSAWRDGDAGKEWPEFYEWLKERGR